MWRNWLPRSPTPLGRSDQGRCRSATMPRQQQGSENAEVVSQQPNISNPMGERKGPFDFLHPKRWRTLSRSRKTSPKRHQSTSPEIASTSCDNSGSCTPTNQDNNFIDVPHDYQESVSTEIHEVTPKAEEANKSMKTSLAIFEGEEENENNSETRRLSRKDFTAEHTRQRALKSSLFNFARRMPEKTQEGTVSSFLKFVKFFE